MGSDHGYPVQEGFRCTAPNTSGQQCRNGALVGRSTCFVHSGLASRAPGAGDRRALGESRRREGYRFVRPGELAMFATERNDGRSWRDLLEEWNATLGEWQQTKSPGAFAKKVRAEYRLTTDGELVWKGAPRGRRRAPNVISMVKRKPGATTDRRK